LRDTDNSFRSKNSVHANVYSEGKALRFFALASAVITLLLITGLIIQFFGDRSGQDLSGALVIALIVFAIITSVILVLKVLPASKPLQATPDELFANESMMDNFFEYNPEIMFIKNLDGSFLSANKMCRQLTDMPEEDFCGRDRFDGFPDQASSTLQEHDMQVLLNNEAMEFHTESKRDGTIRHFKTLRFPMQDKQGEVLAIGGIANDVTDQVNSRHALLDLANIPVTYFTEAGSQLGGLVKDLSTTGAKISFRGNLKYQFKASQIISDCKMMLPDESNIDTRIKALGFVYNQEKDASYIRCQFLEMSDDSSLLIKDLIDRALKNAHSESAVA
jgi:PAS domain S-box-containing protein